MKVGDLVRGIRWSKGFVGYSPYEAYGIIVEVHPDGKRGFWGFTAVVQWIDGDREDLEPENLEVINEGR